MLTNFDRKEGEFNPKSIYELISKYKNSLSFPTIWKLYTENNRIAQISNDCRLHLEAAANQFTNEIWPIQMVDAWGKFPEGILSGHIQMMGDFEECMLLSPPPLDENITRRFNGRYCPVHLVIGPMNPINFSTRYTPNSVQDEEPLYTIGEELNLLWTQPTLGACLPSSCTRDDFNKIFSALTPLTHGILNPVTSYCQTNDKPEVDWAVIGMITACVLLILITLAATLVQVIPPHGLRTPFSKTLSYKTLMAFSLPANLSKLLSTKEASENLGCLHGLRFLSICWVVLGHTWSILTCSPIWNMWRIGGLHSPWTLLTIVNGIFCVDTFFTLAGFLITFQLLNTLDKTDGKFNIFKLYPHRYLRITPTYLFLIGIIATFQPFASNGPLWGIIEMNSKYCRRNWWQNVLYVNNLVAHNPAGGGPYDFPCFAEAWYLGCDMQFFAVSIWLILLVRRNRRLGISVLLILTLASVLIPGWIIGSKNLMPVPIPLRPPTGNETGNYDLDVYVKPWTRYGPYLAGIWAGLAYHLTRTRSFKLPSYGVWSGWIISTGIALSVLYGPNRFFNLEIPLGRIETVLYGALSRFAWGVSIGWIIYACVTGNGGLINKVLSMKIFMPLGRLTFCVYLTSYELQQMFHARYPHPLSYDIYFLVNLFLAHLALSLLIGFWLTLLIESPFINLGKVILGK